MQKRLWIAAMTLALAAFATEAASAGQFETQPACAPSDSCATSCCPAPACYGPVGRPWYRPAPAPVCCPPFAAGPYIMGPIARPSEFGPPPVPPQPPVATEKPAADLPAQPKPVEEPAKKPEAKEATEPGAAPKVDVPPPILPIPAPGKKEGVGMQLRTWSDPSGTHYVVARCIGVLPDGVVRLQKLDGSVVRASIDRLSRVDRDYLRTRQATLASK